MNKLKSTPKYNDYKAKKAAAMRLYRAKKKNDEIQMSDEQKAMNAIEYRENVRARVRKHRERQNNTKRKSTSKMWLVSRAA